MFHWIKTMLLIVLHSSIFGQMSLKEIDPIMVTQKKVRNYVANFEKQNLSYFSDLESSTDSDFAPEQYSCHIANYDFDASLDKLWSVCLTTNPSDLWGGKIISLSFIYNKVIDKLLYKKDLNNYTLQCDQIYFINLRLLKGLFNLPTALKVTKIDSTQHLIEFSYLKGGKSEGRQVLSFIPINENQTKIVHTTHYKSGSRLRDKRLYPHFHELAIIELHKNIESKTKERMQKQPN